MTELSSAAQPQTPVILGFPRVCETVLWDWQASHRIFEGLVCLWKGVSLLLETSGDTQGYLWWHSALVLTYLKSYKQTFINYVAYYS